MDSFQLSSLLQAHYHEGTDISIPRLTFSVRGSVDSEYTSHSASDWLEDLWCSETVKVLPKDLQLMFEETNRHVIKHHSAFHSLKDKGAFSNAAREELEEFFNLYMCLSERKPLLMLRLYSPEPKAPVVLREAIWTSFYIVDRTEDTLDLVSYSDEPFTLQVPLLEFGDIFSNSLKFKWQSPRLGPPLLPATRRYPSTEGCAGLPVLQLSDEVKKENILSMDGPDSSDNSAEAVVDAFFSVVKAADASATKITKRLWTLPFLIDRTLLRRVETQWRAVEEISNAILDAQNWVDLLGMSCNNNHHSQQY